MVVFLTGDAFRLDAKITFLAILVRRTTRVHMLVFRNLFNGVVSRSPV